MKRLLYIFLLFVSSFIQAQDADNSGISLTLYGINQMENIPVSAKKILFNKLATIITKNGVSNDLSNSRFVLVPVVNVLDKEITSTAPTKVALNLELTLFIGDGVTGTLYSSSSFELKGVGSTETKSYISAIKRLSPKNPEILAFLEKGKNKIVDYYNSNCSLLIKQASSMEAQNNFEEALLILTSIPIKSSCFDKVKAKIKDVYQKTIDNECKEKLVEAKSIWNAQQDIEAAGKAGAILETIDPRSACYSEVNKLFTKIEKRVKELGDRDWNYKLKKLELAKTYIKAARDVGVAYGQNQPKNVTYNVKGWAR